MEANLSDLFLFSGGTFAKGDLFVMGDNSRPHDFVWTNGYRLDGIFPI